LGESPFFSEAVAALCILRLPFSHLKGWDVARRIQRMNKKLMKELGQKVAEKRGHEWAPTSFLIDVWE
jgi:hypothetical protein